jgi:hypothetical protein
VRLDSDRGSRAVVARILNEAAEIEAQLVAGAVRARRAGDPDLKTDKGLRADAAPLNRGDAPTRPVRAGNKGGAEGRPGAGRAGVGVLAGVRVRGADEAGVTVGIGAAGGADDTGPATAQATGTGAPVIGGGADSTGAVRLTGRADRTDLAGGAGLSDQHRLDAAGRGDAGGTVALILGRAQDGRSAAAAAVVLAGLAGGTGIAIVARQSGQYRLYALAGTRVTGGAITLIGGGAEDR